MKVTGWVPNVLFLLLSCQIGHALNCYKCDFGTCLSPPITSCKIGDGCSTETPTADFINMKQKGCMDPLTCGSETSTTYNGATVKTASSCCFIDLCNSAATPRMSLVTGLAALVALWLAKLS
ncbi:hypothetical protein FKM82_017654 [Ascaphus truei]